MIANTEMMIEVTSSATRLETEAIERGRFVNADARATNADTGASTVVEEEARHQEIAEFLSMEQAAKAERTQQAAEVKASERTTPQHYRNDHTQDAHGAKARGSQSYLDSLSSNPAFAPVQ